MLQQNDKYLLHAWGPGRNVTIPQAEPAAELAPVFCDYTETPEQNMTLDGDDEYLSSYDAQFMVTQDVLYYQIFAASTSFAMHHKNIRLRDHIMTLPPATIPWIVFGGAYNPPQQAQGDLPSLTKLYEVDEFPCFSDFSALISSFVAVGTGIKEPVLPLMLMDWRSNSAGGYNAQLTDDHNVEQVMYWASRAAIVNLFSQLPGFVGIMRPGDKLDLMSPRWAIRPGPEAVNRTPTTYWITDIFIKPDGDLSTIDYRVHYLFQYVLATMTAGAGSTNFIQWLFQQLTVGTFALPWCILGGNDAVNFNHVIPIPPPGVWRAGGVYPNINALPPLGLLVSFDHLTRQLRAFRFYHHGPDRAEALLQQRRNAYESMFEAQPIREARQAPTEDRGQSYIPPKKKIRFTGSTFAQSGTPPLPTTAAALATVKEQVAVQEAGSLMAQQLIHSQTMLANALSRVTGVVPGIEPSALGHVGRERIDNLAQVRGPLHPPDPSTINALVAEHMQKVKESTGGGVQLARSKNEMPANVDSSPKSEADAKMDGAGAPSQLSAKPETVLGTAAVEPGTSMLALFQSRLSSMSNEEIEEARKMLASAENQAARSSLGSTPSN